MIDTDSVLQIDLACPGMETNGAHTLNVFLVKECENAPELRTWILQGVPGLPEAALIDASMILDPVIVHAAAGMALQQHISPTLSLKSKTLHSELVFSLSGSKHIGRSLAKFGIKDDTTNLLVAMFDASPEDLEKVMSSMRGHVVVGEDAIRKELESICDTQDVCKTYKISNIELEIGNMTDAILSRIAARDCI